MYLNSKEVQWLKERGDRNEEDAFVDKEGKYVWMGGDVVGGEVKVYLPEFNKKQG